MLSAQSRVSFIAGARDHVMPERYEAQQQHRREYVGARARGRLPRAPGQLDFVARISVPAGVTFGDDVAQIAQALDRAGFPVAVRVEHTRAELGVPVVHVIVPGLGCYG